MSVEFRAQLARIHEKFEQARMADHDFRIFGADQHRYDIAPAVSAAEVVAFQAEYGVTLPDAYRVFVTEFAAGGAGPFFGLYRFRRDMVHPDRAAVLALDAQVSPDMADEDWAKLTAVWDDDDLHDAAFDAASERVFSGILPLGFQGCESYHGLLLTGPYRGQVINYHIESKPVFAFEHSFLDWYERWLDEVISGQLRASPGEWFGYQPARNLR